MENKYKILACGDVCGNFKQFFQRIETINRKSGPFDALLCVGDFFGESEQSALLDLYKRGARKVPVPTYILGPNSEEHAKFYDGIADNEICENLYYLGKRGIFTLINGIKIVYLSGLEAPSDGAHNNAYQFTKADILAVRDSCFAGSKSTGDYRGVDILVTSQWPYGALDAQNANASKLISYLSREIKPRYHFCGLNGSYHEPAPFRMPADASTELSLCTRLIALASIGNEQKQKYIFAISLAPVEKMRLTDLIQKTTNETTCPYIDLDIGDKKLRSEASNKRQYFYDTAEQSQDSQPKRRKIQEIKESDCWFCLSSKKVLSHLVITVGDDFYLALAKGPINDYHSLIMSTEHIANVAQLVHFHWQELLRLKHALRKFFESQGQVVCFTERNYRAAHLQINVIAIDKGLAWKIEHTFQDKAEEYNLQFETLPELNGPDILPRQGAYFVAELPDGKALLTRDMKRFPLDFVRDVFCTENLLNCEERVDWRACEDSKEREMELVANFRMNFQPFDTTDETDYHLPRSKEERKLTEQF